MTPFRPDVFHLQGTVRRGFSLIEIIIVLGIIALIGGLFALNFDLLLKTFDTKSPEKFIHETIRSARYWANLKNEPILLQYDTNEKACLITTRNNELVEKITNESGFDIEMILQNNLIQTRDGFHENKLKNEFKPIPFATFNTDLSSTPIEFIITQKNSTYSLWVDPFSSVIIDKTDLK